MPIRRFDYLAIDRDLLRQCRASRSVVKFAMSKSAGWEVMPLNQRFPMAYTTMRQVQYSCNKLGVNLFAANDNGVDFNLHDLNMHHNRITLEYNAFHDPALAAYFQQPVQRKRLRERNLVNDRNDVICSRRFFFQYLRFLEARQAQIVLKTLTQKVRIMFIKI